MKLLQIIMTVVFFIVVLYSDVNARALRRSCGKYLADRISDLCKARGGYNQLSSSDSAALSHHRSKRGVVDECCKQSCTDTTLMQYCMEQVEEPAVEVVSKRESKSTTLAPTEKSVEQVKFTTRFPMNTIPMEIGTVRPEFNNIKYIGIRRKQHHYYY